MRTNGVDERFCTGKDTTDWEKFEKWAGNNITQIGEQPADREEWNGKPNKLQYLEK
jgi:glucuronate isomerase